MGEEYGVRIVEGEIGMVVVEGEVVSWLAPASSWVSCVLHWAWRLASFSSPSLS